MPEESRGSDCHEEKARAGIAALGEGSAALFIRQRQLAAWPGCHFVARPPFRAAAGAGLGGRGRRRRPRAGLPPGAKAGGSPLFFAYVPLAALRLCRDPPRTRAG